MPVSFTTSVRAIFHCSLERAFKTPMLCDVSKVHTGYGLMPAITHCSDDANWGKPGGTKKVYAARSLTFKGGEVSMDKVIERVENKYWIIEVSDFKSWMLGFDRFTGTWKTTELAENTVQIDYTYTLHARTILFFPLNWLFTKWFWHVYMKKVMENIRRLADKKEPYLYP
ncbi:MAG: hypothetical protein R2794_00250 [Chitinophagales bacterium]